MKKMLLSLLVFASTSMYAQNGKTTFVVDDVTYTVTAVDQVELTQAGKKAKEVTNLVIPSTVSDGTNNYKVTSIAEAAYQWTNATSIKIPGSVKTIGRAAFYYGSPTTILLGNGVKSIGSYAFSGKNLTELDIPSSVKAIGDHAFFGTSTNSKFSKLTLHEGLEEIGDGAFYGNAIETLEIPSTCKKIGASAFLYSTKLKSLTFYEGLEEIGDGAFVNGEYANNSTKDLTSVTLPKSLKKLGIEAFLRMPLTSINIPEGLEELGESAFAKTNIATITVDPANEHFMVDEKGVLYSKNKKILYAVPMKGLNEYVVSNDCIGINGGAFWGSPIEKVTLPDSMLALGYGAFLESSLKTINLPNTISYIDEYCFAGTKLERVVLPENLYYIYEATFAQCPNLQSVIIPSSVQAIDVRAFYLSNNLTSVMCKRSTPPYLVEAYEGEEEFSSAFTLYVPKGCASTYKASKVEGNDNYWINYFNKVEEMDKGILKPVAASPAVAETLDVLQPASFQIQFDTPITCINDKPEAAVRIDAPYMSGQVIGNEWHASAVGNTLTVYATDETGDVARFQTSDSHVYYVTIPAGVVKSAAGDENEYILLGYYGYGHKTGIDEAMQSSKIDNGKVVARYNINGQQTTAQQKGLQIVRFSDGTAKKTFK